MAYNSLLTSVIVGENYALLENKISNCFHEIVAIYFMNPHIHFTYDLFLNVTDYVVFFWYNSENAQLFYKIVWYASYE